MALAFRLSILSGSICKNNRLFGSSAKLKEQYNNITTYYSDSDNACLYDDLWGEGNFHPGYFPHLIDSSAKKLSFIESALEFNKYMVTKSDINLNSNVIDFGCGKGGATIQISKMTQCNILGIDLTPYHIAQANKLCLQENDAALIKRCKFECKSFVDGLNDEYYNKYTHVFSQIAINHVQNYFDSVCVSAANVLQTDGVIVWSDFIGSKSYDDKDYVSLLNRLHLPPLLTHNEYFEKIQANGFKVDLYENLNNHIAEAYTIVADEAKEVGKHDWAKKWYNTAKLANNDQFGMNFVIASKQ